MHEQKQEQDYYKILGINNNANNEEIKRAYKKLAMIHHPDKNQNNKQSSLDSFRQIAEAYQTLSDTQKRQSYDLLSLNGLMSKYPSSNYMTAESVYNNLYKQSNEMKDENDNEYLSRRAQDFINELINKKTSNLKTNSKNQPNVNEQKFSKIPKKQQSKERQENKYLDQQIFSRSVNTATKTINGNTVTTKKITVIKKDGTKDITQQIYDNGRKNVKTYRLGVGESLGPKKYPDKC